MGERKSAFDVFIENYEIRTKERLKYIDLANKLQMNKSTFSKVLNEKGRQLKESEVKELAEILGVTCDEIIYNTEKENIKYHRKYGLSNSTLNWIYDKNKDNPKLIEVLNIIFSDHNIADYFFEALYFFANSRGIRISQTDILGETVYTPFNNPKEMAWAVISEYLKTVFEYIEDYYHENIINPIKENIISNALNTLRNKKTEIDYDKKLKEEIDADISDLNYE